MAVITYETSDGDQTISALDISYKGDMSAWIVDLGEGGSSNISNIGSNVQQLVIPEQRVYQVELTERETLEKEEL